MKYLPLISRILLGLMFLGAGIAGLAGKVPPPEPEAAKVFMGALYSSGLLPFIKVLEIICGILLLSGFFVPAVLFILAPIIFNIAWYHFGLDPATAPVGVILTILWIGTALQYKSVFRPFLQAKLAMDK